MRIAQVRNDSGDVARNAPRLAEVTAAREKSSRFVQVSFAEVEISETAIRSDEVQRLTHRLSNLYPFLSPGDPLGEVAKLGKHVDQPEPGANREQPHPAEAL